MLTFSPLLAAALAMGFLGSPHCLGMCGGLVTAFGMSMESVSPAKKRGLVATYHVGRIMSYALLGVIAALIGTTLLGPLMTGNNLPRILLGLVLVFIGATMLGAPFMRQLEKLGMGFWKKLAPLRKKVFPLTTYPRALAAGLLWGFLPCGLVYGALLMAAVEHNAGMGALTMVMFGLGTVPMLVATHETVGWLNRQISRFHLRQLNGVVMMASGAAVIAIPLLMGGHAGHINHSEHNGHANTMHNEALLSQPSTHNHQSESSNKADHHNMSHTEDAHAHH